MRSRSTDAERPAEHTDWYGVRLSLAAFFAWLGWPQRKRAAVIPFPGSPSPDPPAASVIPRLRAA